MIQSVHILRQPCFDTLVVDPNASDPDTFSTISAALLCCKPYGTIVVRTGRYHEQLRLEKPVEIVGTGPASSTVLIGIDGPAIEVSRRIVGRIVNMRIEQQALSISAAMSGAVFVKGGAKMIIEECSLTSAAGHCIVVQGLHSYGYVMHNIITNAKGVGVLVCDHGKGVVEDNVISFSNFAGVAVLNGADPHVRRNKIHEGMDSGVLISQRGRGVIEENDIFGNLRAGVAILKEGAPLVKRNQIHDGRDSGVLVCEDGKGDVCENDIFGNQTAGVASASAAPRA
eukprot:CAMPEP_0119353072 /NCGR_PEP_ID=MMETSP1334-20130426/2287_1 /TAXON_ID=127549 /ORGANISM="Calcidiscus leptoporus, Strain RCC1130" /LENGTH=283 /DNA_ID=CAMNT_0007366273 /DNA_START=416 /DNA_END=1267 /DNA_ORIENTATION=-